MTFKNIAGLALLFVLVALGIHWYINRPTIQDTVLTDFFHEFTDGSYIEATKYTAGDDFYKMAAATSVRDSDGTEYLIKDYFPESRSYLLQSAIETYIRPHIARWKYLFMETERLTETSAIVHFRIEIAVRDYSGGDLLASVIHNGRVEGNAHMELENGEWAITRFELNIFSDEGLVLSNYMEQAN